MPTICYMCEKEGGTTEHVPPQCLFPENKDLPTGVHLRRNLITVPSCVEHNSKKSKDDEYLLYTLVMNLPANGAAFQQFTTKVMRAINRKPALVHQLFAKITDLIVEDTVTGNRFKTIGYQIDENRFCCALEKVARGLYFHHFKTQWLGKVDVRPEFLLSLNEQHSLETNAVTQKIAEASNQLFKASEIYGDNPEVFYYQVHLDPERGVVVMRISFYGSGHVTIVFRS